MSDFAMGVISGWASLFVFVVVCLAVCVNKGGMSVDDLDASCRPPRLPR